MSETSREDTSSSLSNTPGVRSSIDLSSREVFSRSFSLDMVYNKRSSRRDSVNENICSGTRQDSLSRRSNRSSGRKGSVSLSRDVGDRILESIRLSRELTDHILGEVDGSMFAQVGDDGGRAMLRDREDDNGSLHFSLVDKRIDDNCVVVPNDDEPIQSNVFQSGLCVKELSSPMPPFAEETMSPLPTDAILHSADKNHIQNKLSSSFKEKPYKLPHWPDYISYLIHLAVFGILGVFTRYLLQKLFGPGLLALTSDNNPLYLDLPANMLGSFLMGWFGVVFKADIRHVSDHLVIGLSTGYLGSVTTFSGWNQKMLDAASKGHWVSAIGGIILGMLIVNESIRIGVESANGFRSFLDGLRRSSERTKCSLENWRVDSPKRHIVVMIVMMLALGSLMGLSGALAREKLDNITNGAVLWLGCLVGPPGVWTRWYLARLNGQGFGRKEYIKWLPIGTLSANILAATLMAALATISKAVDSKKCTIILNGIQFGFLGCMSTVSTFVAEVYAMRESGHSGRAIAYATMTILPSFVIGTLIYSVPVWAKNYK